VRFVTAVHVFRYGYSCVWAPILPIGLALHLGAPLANLTCLALGPQPWPGSSCLSLRHFIRLGAHVANSPCIAFGHPSCKLTLHCVQAPDLGEFVLKNLPPSQNWFLSILQLVFSPSAPLCGRFCYGSSCISLWMFVRFVMALRAFGHPSCHLALHCVWVPLFPTHLALPLVTQKILHRKFQKIRSEWLERFQRNNRVII
jgi:hypothetical protein